MRYLPLIWAGLWRKRARTILTLLSVITAFVLFGILSGVTAGFSGVISRYSDATRLRMQNRVNITGRVPLAYRARIESVPGVTGVLPVNMLLAYYRNPRNGFGGLATDMTKLKTLEPDFIISQRALRAMRQTPNGAIVGRALLTKYGWHVGDRVTIKSRVWRQQKNGSYDWTFDIVGSYKLKDGAVPQNDEFLVNYGYFDEARGNGRGTVSIYMIKVGDARHAAQIGRRIDALFRNSAYETLTQTERAYLRTQIDRVGDIGFIVDAIVGAVLFTLLFLTGNTMMQSVRERIPELAVLKTYGFESRAITALVLAESLLLCLVAAALGLAIAAAAFPSVYDALGIVRVPLPAVVVGGGLGFAVALAVLSALPPVWRAQHLKLVDALAGR